MTIVSIGRAELSISSRREPMNIMNPNVDPTDEDIQKAAELLKKLRPDGKGEGFDLIVAGFKQIAEEWSAMTNYPFKDTLELLLSQDGMMTMADGIRLEILGERKPDVPPTTPQVP
jgi:hypothetical protein